MSHKTTIRSWVTGNVTLCDQTIELIFKSISKILKVLDSIGFSLNSLIMLFSKTNNQMSFVNIESFLGVNLN